MEYEDGGDVRGSGEKLEGVDRRRQREDGGSGSSTLLGGVRVVVRNWSFRMPGSGAPVGRASRPLAPRKSALLSREQRAALQRKRQLKRRERRGTLVLGFIMGSFIACWMPFFTLYLLGALPVRAPALLGDLFFWLGYCNSAFNPVSFPPSEPPLSYFPPTSA